ncbi:siamois homeodomain 2 S homeolog isoform X1 [Xenopus laevis]|uniref:Homeobox protein siamois n=1 Tax=Xenopus laevis TaxID=8355 RepID=B7ZS16_XENLA|nr:siamois homeodomain 2 S homeolog isoform X1 [Xenopus laevis]AAI70363.1 Twn-A protein [Xenopus laevis]OCT59463.1 hypothetical protein XELAEV_18000885mg [Xenopus laevis]BAV57541.1 siamois homeodomain 2.S [Xenopus laevis]
MTCDSELEQIIYTALTLQDDYPVFCPPQRDQTKSCSSSFGMFPDSYPGVENQGILQETIRELYSVLGIPQDSHFNRSMKHHLLEPKKATLSTGIYAKPTCNQTPKACKRPFCEEEQREGKKPRIEMDHCLPSAPNRCRRRTIYSKEQILFLQNQFDLNPYPDFVKRCHIAKITGIPEPRIQVWFQNRRARHLLRAINSQVPQEKRSAAAEEPRCFTYREPQYPDMWG